MIFYALTSAGPPKEALKLELERAKGFNTSEAYNKCLYIRKNMFDCNYFI